jgi:hypothetical protein
LADCATDHLHGEYQALETKVTLMTNDNNAFDVPSKHLRWPRDKQDLKRTNKSLEKEIKEWRRWIEKQDEVKLARQLEIEAAKTERAHWMSTRGHRRSPRG